MPSKTSPKMLGTILGRQVTNRYLKATTEKVEAFGPGPSPTIWADQAVRERLLLGSYQQSSRENLKIIKKNKCDSYGVERIMNNEDPQGINLVSLAKVLVREGSVLWLLPGFRLEQLGGRCGHHRGGRKPKQAERTMLALDTPCLTHEGAGPMAPEPVDLELKYREGKWRSRPGPAC